MSNLTGRFKNPLLNAVMWAVMLTPMLLTLVVGTVILAFRGETWLDT